MKFKLERLPSMHTRLRKKTKYICVLVFILFIKNLHQLAFEVFTRYIYRYFRYLDIHMSTCRTLLSMTVLNFCNLILSRN